MKESIESLIAFILDFGLKQPNKAIHFDALIEYHLNKKMTTVQSEVQIITSDNLATIYLVSKEKLSEELPDMFDAKKENITYIPVKYLVIKQPNGYIAIYPQIN